MRDLVDNDPRGLLRKVVSVDDVLARFERGLGSSETVLTLSCGHTQIANPTFSYRVGEDSRCLTCLDDMRRELESLD